jgi:hypothetical protein
MKSEIGNLHTTWRLLIFAMVAVWLFEGGTTPREMKVSKFLNASVQSVNPFQKKKGNATVNGD